MLLATMLIVACCKGYPTCSQAKAIAVAECEAIGPNYKITHWSCTQITPTCASSASLCQAALDDPPCVEDWFGGGCD